MKRTIFVIFYVILSFFVTSHAFAETVEINTRVNGPGGQPTDITINVARGEESSLQLLRDKRDLLLSPNTKIISSDLSVQDLVEGLEGALSTDVNEIQGQSVIFAETDESVESLAAKEAKVKFRERIHGVTFAFLQTGIQGYIFLNISSLPEVTAITSTALAGAISLYFNWDIERWDQLQRWGRDKLKKGAALIGKESWQEKYWFNKVTKSITGYGARVAFATLFVGVGLWDSFLTDFLSAHTVQAVLTSSFVTTLMGQPFDTTFGDWLENGHDKFSETAVQLMLRSRALISAGIIPLVYMGSEAGYVAAGAMFVGGVSVMIYDNVTQNGAKFNLSYSKIKNSFKTFWNEKIKNKICNLILGGTSK